MELETLAVERRQLMQLLGKDRARALKFRTGFEQGRRDGARHYGSFNENARLALQAALVFGQLQGRFIVDPKRFEFDLEAGTLFREIECDSCVEAVIHGMTMSDAEESICWNTAGYLSGHVSEILDRRVFTVETECVANGGECCRFISRLDAEFGSEIDWMRAALEMESVNAEIEKRDRLVKNAQGMARRAQRAYGALGRQLEMNARAHSVIANAEAMEPVMRRMRHLSASNAAMLLTGEAGTGKETMARAIHRNSARKSGPFVIMDCRAIGADLVDQELFGFARESGESGETGFLARAHAGTIYIDGIAAMPAESQIRLAAVIREGKIVAPDATPDAPCDVRIICGCDEDPQEMIAQGRLTEKLYYALAMGRIDLPPLRERGADIIPIADKFLQESKTRHNRPEAAMSDEFKSILIAGAWPGNLRQLRNVIEHALLMSSGGVLTPDTLPDEVLTDRWNREPRELTEEVIRAALQRTGNNKSKAAELLGVGRTTLWRAMKRFSVA